MIRKLTRRSAVAMATAGLVTGCSGGGRAADASPTVAPDPGAAVRRKAARDSVALAARYDAVAAAHPELAARLAPLRSETARHAAAFGGKVPAAGTGTGTSPAVPPDEKTALARLAAAERALADQRAAALLDAPGELARLLASVAASGAAHAVLLGPGNGGKATA